VPILSRNKLPSPTRMAELSLPTFDIDQVFNVPLAAVDAGLAVYFQRMRDTGLSRLRNENIPNRLVVYTVTLYAPEQEYGDCGHIYVQFIDDKKTRVSCEVAPPDKYGAARFAVDGTLRMMGGLNPEKLKQNEFERGSLVLRGLRLQVLSDICARALAHLVVPVEAPAAPAAPEKKPAENNAGRPGLFTEEKVHRLALVVLEKRLKRKDPGFTRGEFVFLVQQKLQLAVEMNTVKNAVSLLERAAKNGEEQLLAAAETLADHWQARLE